MKKTILVISQTFVPDPASVGQHMADVAVELARRGHRVRVYASARGYENPKLKYPKREDLKGVDVRRLGMASFGKKNIFLRVLGTASFLTQSAFLCLFTPNLQGIFFSTSPPLVGLAAVFAKWVRRVPIAYWAMDLNPDQLILSGRIKEKSATARVLEWVNRRILKNSDFIVALDRFMAGRLLKRGDFEKKMLVMPPWPHEEHISPPPREENPFRKAHGLGDKFVVMYSGNHSPANPLITLLDAAVALRERDDIRFLFVGGGLAKKDVERYIAEHGLKNVVSLPYQPLAELGNSLGAADVHVVSLGNAMVGVVHPCKIYGAMAVGRPILFLGPKPSHVTDILDRLENGKAVMHGDVEGCARAILELREASPASRGQMGRVGQQEVREHLSQSQMCGRFCDGLEKAFRIEPAGTAPAPETSVPTLQER